MKKEHFYLILAVVIILATVSILVFKNDKANDIIELKASVEYSDKKFVITNNDTTDFVHANISIDNYYKIRDCNLRTGETYTIWQTEFLHHNGRHYPVNRRPSQFSIWCETQSGKNGFYSKRIR